MCYSKASNRSAAIAAAAMAQAKTEAAKMCLTFTETLEGQAEGINEHAINGEEYVGCCR